MNTLCTTRPDKHGLVFLVPCNLFSLSYCTCAVDNTLFKRYQKHTAMFNWSPCIKPAVWRGVHGDLSQLTLYTLGRRSHSLEAIDLLTDRPDIPPLPISPSPSLNFTLEGGLHNVFTSCSHCIRLDDVVTA